MGAPALLRRRLRRLVGAGLVDSLCLSAAWTVVVLEVDAAHGLAGVGVCTAALLVGTALSAPVATAAARVLDGRALLRSAAAAEAVLRAGLFALVVSGAPLWAVAGCVAALGTTAWTGYAGMRAEVASVTSGAATWATRRRMSRARRTPQSPPTVCTPGTS